MSKFDRILSDSELLDVYRSLENPKHDRDSVIGAMSAAVDAAMRKLAEQEPVANVFYIGGVACIEKTGSEVLYKGMKLYAHPVPCVSPTSVKTACVSEKTESETQASGQVNLDSSKQEDSQELPPLPEADVYGYKDSYSEELLVEYAKSAIDCHRTAKNRAPDDGKMLNLSLSVDTKETQALLQSYLDGLDGWQLAPKEPTDEMLNAGGHANSEWLNDNAPIGESRYAMPMKSVYQTMLAAAPKYTGGKSE